MSPKKTAAITRKEAAVSFLEHAAGGEIDYAYETHVAPSFRHHNPFYESDSNSLRQGMKEMSDRLPNKKFEVKRAIEEGDYVAVHSHVVMGDETDISVVHIFRFDDEDRIVELWDVGQEIPEKSPNKLGMF